MKQRRLLCGDTNLNARSECLGEFVNEEQENQLYTHKLDQDSKPQFPCRLFSLQKDKPASNRPVP